VAGGTVRVAGYGKVGGVMGARVRTDGAVRTLGDPRAPSEAHAIAASGGDAFVAGIEQMDGLRPGGHGRQLPRTGPSIRPWGWTRPDDRPGCPGLPARKGWHGHAPLGRQGGQAGPGRSKE